jgi:small GTP-binding protein
MNDLKQRQSVKRGLRLFLALAFLVFALLILLLALQLTESALSIWGMLDQQSPTLLALYATGLIGFLLLTLLVLWWLLRPRKRHLESGEARNRVPVDPHALEQALREAEAQGVDTSEPRHELIELERRTSEALPYVAFFGSVSSGKSTLIGAITGDAGIETDPRAGTTRQVVHYRFGDGGSADLYLTDAPGILDLDEEKVRVAREEARRADLVVYVCDGELTRDQHAEALELMRYERPMVAALNKKDRYSDSDLTDIVQRLQSQLPGIEIVPVQAGGKERVVRLDAEGRETEEERERAAQIEPLMKLLREKLDSESGRLGRQRDESLMRLGAEKLAQARQRHRRDAAEQVVRNFARKAMVGAMAAISPGTDVLIQGYLGVQMVRELARVYGVKVGQTDLDRFVALAGEHVGKRLTLLLALAGNVLKAFPGIGTVSGGLLHAVAYGMIFEGLGRAVARTLDESGDLQRRQALDYFEEYIGGDMEGRAKHFARLAWREFVAKK